MQHHFDVDLASRYGMVEAILINHFEYWIELNRTNDRNFYDGRYWTFNSMKAMTEIFPYLTEKKIRNALKNLQDEGLILTGNYNRSAYDRTLWYAFSDFAESILPKGLMEVTQKANGNIQKGEPIPNNNSYNNTSNKTNNNIEKRKRFTPPSIDEVRKYCHERVNGIDPEAFIDYYEARGWKYGQGKQMADWKAAIRTWEKRNGGTSNRNADNTNTQSNSGQSSRWNITYDVNGNEGSDA